MTQVETALVSISSVMRSQYFAAGVASIRRGEPFDWTVDSWAYERGRLFGALAPLDMPIKIGRTLNPKALALYRAAVARELIL